MFLKKKAMKRFKPMICPVCGEFYFSGPFKDACDEEIDKYLNGIVQCSHCGWIYDVNQANNSNSKEGLNAMPVNDYKKAYIELVKANPNYKWEDQSKK